MSNSGNIVLGVSGASGTRLGLRAVALLAASPDITALHLVVSQSALRVAQNEVGTEIRSTKDFLDAAGLEAATRKRIIVHGDEALDAPISSGSFPTLGMAILPCSAGTLSAVAHGLSRGLIQRAADVCLKERRRLVLGFRETPYSLIHAENLLLATRAGAIVAPPVPAFYAASSMEEILDAYLLRVADLLRVRIATKDFRWKGAP